MLGEILLELPSVLSSETVNGSGGAEIVFEDAWAELGAGGGGVVKPFGATAEFDGLAGVFVGSLVKNGAPVIGSLSSADLICF